MDRYKNLIKGLRKDFWAVVFEIGDFEQVCRMHPDDLLEARAAQKVFSDEIKKKGGQ